MNTQTNRARPAKATPHTAYVPRLVRPLSAPRLDEEVYPGITRAQLREDIIDQIG